MTLSNITGQLENKYLMSFEDYIPKEIRELYEVHDFRHAAAILANEFPKEFEDVCHSLAKFRFTKNDITKKGGNESNIPKLFSDILRPRWVEGKLNSRLLIDEEEITSDTHKIDYLRGRIAFDLEWNSKDQTFDRDLYAMRTFFEFGKVSVGIIVTRSLELNAVFEDLGVDEKGKAYKDKYGASTTHMGKLIPRIKAGRNGGCPIIVFGITPRLITE